MHVFANLVTYAIDVHNRFSLLSIIETTQLKSFLPNWLVNQLQRLHSYTKSKVGLNIPQKPLDLHLMSVLVPVQRFRWHDLYSGEKGS